MLESARMHGFPFIYSPFAPLIVGIFTILFVMMVAVFALKGYALWCAARAGQKWWFVALFIINTLGILEVVYLIWFRPKNGTKHVEEPVVVSSSAPKS